MAQKNSRLRRLTTAVVLVLALARSGQSAAQSAPPCTTPECVSRDRLWTPAARVHEIKNQFVAAVRQFTESVAGAFGDEGPRLSSSLDAMGRIVTEWDAAIRAYEATIAGVPETAETHVALATVYLDRHRPEDALKELAAAGRLDESRADVHSIGALAHGLAGRPARAAEELRDASRLDGGDPITLYGLSQQFAQLDRRDQAADALRRFQEVEWPRLRNQRNRQPSAPFERASLLRQVAGVSPVFPLHAYRAGFVLLLDGQYVAAVTEFRRAAAADALVSTTGVADHAAALRRGQLGAALSGLEASAAGNGPGRGEALRSLSVAYWIDGQFDQSAARLGDVIRLAPDDERARIALADVLIDAGRQDDAERELKAAILAVPDSGQLHYRLGQLYRSRSLFPQATRELEEAAKLTPLVGLDRLYETIGGTYSSQADFDHVVAAYLKRIEANPNNADAHKSLGEIYALQGRNDEALAEFAVTLLIDPKNLGGMVGASQVYLRLNRFDEALDLSRQALAIDSRLKDARYAQAMSLLRLGRAEEGRRELAVFERMQAEVMAATTRQSELNTLRRDAAQRLAANDYAAAATLFLQAISLDPGDAILHRDLGSALVKSGQYSEAVKALNRSVELGDNVEAHRLLADVFKALGRTADADAQTALAARLNDRAKAERLQRLSGAR